MVKGKRHQDRRLDLGGVNQMKCGYSANNLKGMDPAQPRRSPPFIIVTEKDLSGSCKQWVKASGRLFSSPFC